MFDKLIPQEMFAGVQDFMRIMQTNRDFLWWAETLIVEETKELRKADVENEGMEQIFKESADLFYVVCGFYNCIPMAAPMILSEEQNASVQGIIEDAWNALAETSTKYKIPMNLYGEAFAIVHMSNMSKLDENGEPIRREDGKILKGPNYQAPNMAPVVMKWNNSSNRKHKPMLTALTDENFHDEVREANQPVVIHVQDMWDEVSSPHMAKMSGQRTDIKFMTALVQDVPDFEDNLAIESVPCYVLFTDGMVQEISYEAMNFGDLHIWLTENV